MKKYILNYLIPAVLIAGVAYGQVSHSDVTVGKDNFAEKDLTATADRSHDFGNNDLVINNVGSAASRVDFSNGRMELQAQSGNGVYVSNSNGGGRLRIEESLTQQGDYFEFRAPFNLPGSIDIELPNDIPDTDDVLQITSGGSSAQARWNPLDSPYGISFTLVDGVAVSWDTAVGAKNALWETTEAAPTLTIDTSSELNGELFSLRVKCSNAGGCIITVAGDVVSYNDNFPVTQLSLDFNELRYISFRRLGSTLVIDEQHERLSDNTSSDYFDIGEMRMQWGSFSPPGTGANTVTLPVACDSSTYSITIGVSEALNRSVGTSNKTTTSFDATVFVADTAAASDTDFDWKVICDKP